MRSGKNFPESDFVPESEWPKVFLVACVWVGLWAAVIVLAVASGSILPLLYVGAPSFIGFWLLVFFTLPLCMPRWPRTFSTIASTRAPYI